MVPNNLYVISPMGYSYVPMNEPVLRQALIDVFGRFHTFELLFHFLMCSSIFTHQKYDLAKDFIRDITGFASCKLFNTFGCKVFGIITRFPHMKQP